MRGSRGGGPARGMWARIYKGARNEGILDGGGGGGRRKGRTQGRDAGVQCGLWDFNLIKQFVTEYGTRQ